jgi:hypothetical protein
LAAGFLFPHGPFPAGNTRFHWEETVAAGFLASTVGLPEKGVLRKVLELLT